MARHAVWPMEWQDVGVLMAMVGVIGGFALTLRGQRQDERLSEVSASRSEAAARLTADNTERVLKALEVIAAKEFGSASGANPPTPRVAWTLMHHSGDKYQLTNIGDAEAFDVRVTAHDSMYVLHGLADGPSIRPGEAETFMAVASSATSDKTITVKWRADSNTTQQSEWRYPLPPRPPRS